MLYIVVLNVDALSFLKTWFFLIHLIWVDVLKPHSPSCFWLNRKLKLKTNAHERTVLYAASFIFHVYLWLASVWRPWNLFSLSLSLMHYRLLYQSSAAMCGADNDDSWCVEILSRKKCRPHTLLGSKAKWTPQSLSSSFYDEFRVPTSSPSVEFKPVAHPLFWTGEKE